ncbi:transcription antiterminator [Leifsonia sp. ZF2019]|uniref:BglG family transcription antiterminator n=1 Tax=Leifsonia sp. ZF2019 TaxID=2781978 RepID=UPI001CC18F24|nr:PRD domain-containing protein [Leifsonia sp. ZF2019]UAJ79643.1 transcription antiterminator [Leifsonia sp. ZF2019]
MALSAQQTRMLDILARRAAWVTAAELAHDLGVTTRSIRTYAAALGELVESGANGYRVRQEAYAAHLDDSGSGDPGPGFGSPQERLVFLARRLLDEPEGVDVYEAAESLFVSESTIESDLTRLRGILADTELALHRQGPVVLLTGPEIARRKLISRLFRDEMRQGVVDIARIQEAFSSSGLGAFKSDLVAMLDARGFFVNEYGINDVLLHMAVALDRVAKDRVLPAVGDPETSEAIRSLADDLGGLVDTHFDVVLDPTELRYLAILLRTRVIAPAAGRDTVEEFVSEADLEVVRGIVARASTEYLVDLRDENFIVRLTLHVQNLVARAHQKSYSRNPLTRSIKSSYPMIYELAVYIASRLQAAEGIEVNDDEIAYIAMHVGAYLEQQSRRRDAITCAVVCPNYYDMHILLRERLESALGDELDVTSVITSADADWAAIDADLVLTTIDPRGRRENAVIVQPFVTETDVEHIRQAVARIRRQRRRARIKNDLLEYFDERLFLRNFYARDAITMIRALGDRMMAVGAIDQDYVDQTIEREQMSSTAFTDSLAVPHAMTMSAKRTAIAIVVNDTAMDWGDARVNVIAFIAFDAGGRASFQTVFDQFVEVFGDREAVLGLIRRADTFTAFIDELVRIIDS